MTRLVWMRMTLEMVWMLMMLVLTRTVMTMVSTSPPVTPSELPNLYWLPGLA